MDGINVARVQAALQEIRPFVHRTPVITSKTVDALAGCNILMKCENLQKVGAFKIRGATNAIRSILSSNRDISPLDVTVVTHSSGNHAQALALASLQLGTRCHVVMPNNAPAVKKAAVLGYGAVVTECEPTLQAREDTASRVVQEEMDRQRNSGTKGIVEFVPPYDDARVICGQGTLALELLEQAKEIDRPLDIIITPVGGGGMLSGCAVASKGVDPSILVFGAEPAGADDAHRSFESKTFVPSIKPNTIADGLLTSLGDITFPLILKYVDGIYTVSDSEIIHTMKLVYARVKLVIEPSAAVPLAVALYSTAFRNRAEALTKDKRRSLNVGVVFSGGNVELTRVLKLFESVEADVTLS